MSPEPTPSFSFSESDEPDGALRLRLRGELDLTVVEPLRRRLDQLRSQRRRAVLDLAELEFIDSAGIMLFVTAANAARDDGGEFVLTQAQGEVERVLELTGLSEMLRFEPPRPDGESAA